MYLEEILGSIQLKSELVATVENLDRENIFDWLKTVAGFANAKGGDFYIGVKKETIELIGFERTMAHMERKYFDDKISQHLYPLPQVQISFIQYTINESERFIIKAHINESPYKPVILKYKNVPSIYMRRDGYTNGATYEEIIEMSISSKKAQYDTLFSKVKYELSCFKDLQNFYKSHNNEQVLSDKKLKSLGFIDENGYLANGALLFMDEYDGDKTGVKCSVYSGFNKGAERIVSINNYNGNITSSIEYMLDFVKQRMNHGIIKLDEERLNIDAYPSRALFEGIINAVAHRDYYLDGTEIAVDIFKDRLEITSPGGFYQREKLGKTFDLSHIISKRRNELITGILVASNVMEAAGAGFDKIVEDYSNADENHKPYVISSSDHFTLVLPDLTYEDGVREANLPVLNFAPVSNGTPFDSKILSYCYYGARKASDIATYLGVSDSTYFRKTVLDNLVTNGYLEKNKVDRAFYYKTNREIVELK